MRTTKGLMEANTYKSGKTVYKGAIYGRYASTYHQTVTIQPQISNGGKVVLPTESNIRSACEGLQKGQIGARKHSVKLDGKTTILNEAIAECNDLDSAKLVSTVGKTAEEWLEPELSYDGPNGEKLTLSEVKAIRADYQASNKAIRESIESLKKAYNWKEGSKMSEELMKDISKLMQGYQTLTGLDIVITVHDKHVINKTDDYVSCSDVESYKRLLLEANYNDQGNRLVARTSPVKVIIPIQKIEQVETVKRILFDKFTTAFTQMKGIEVVASDTFQVPGVSLINAKEFDSKVSNRS